MRLLLASRSATRRRMLEAAGVSFESVAATLDEEAEKAALRKKGAGAHALAGTLALRKALSAEDASVEDLVIGSDQTLERDDGTMLDKPISRQDALAQLRSLSGRVHRLHSAAVIVEAGQAAWSFTETVELAVRPLGDAFLEAYLDREYEAIGGSVGGYRIEGPGAQLFERIEGSHFAILGMPLLPLLAYLRTRGFLPS